MGRRGEGIGRQGGLTLPGTQPFTRCNLRAMPHPSSADANTRSTHLRNRPGPGRKLASICATVLCVAGGGAPALATTADTAINTVVVAQGLANPWGLAFLPDGRFLVTERKGSLRVIEANGSVGPPLAGLPRISAGGQGGLLDVVLDSGFARNRTLYVCFSEPGDGGNSTAVARVELAADASQLTQVKVIFSQRPKVASSLHFGCRIAQPTPDTLFVTLGERFSRADDAQTLDNHHGKVVRIHTDGSVPTDNPFVG